MKSSIVIPPNAGRTTRFAARELARYLAEATAAVCEIAEQPADDAQYRFYLGNTEEPFAAADPDDANRRLRHDGVWLRKQGNDFILYGKSRRGALFAVYTFLTDKLGCRWPEVDREVIPESSLEMADFELLSNPRFQYRGSSINECSDAFVLKMVDWMAKNRMNQALLNARAWPESIQNALLDRGFIIDTGCHSIPTMYPADRYFEAHPEHFALNGGKRVGNTQLCFSNHGSVPEIAKNYLAYLDENPWVDIMGMWPADGYGFCECEACQATPMTDLMVSYINAVADEIKKVHPEKRCELLSYINYTVPPENTPPADTLTVLFCEYWSRSQWHPITADVNANAKTRAEMERWAKLAREFYLLGYYTDDCIKRFLYNPVPDVIVADFAYYQQHDFCGLTLCTTYPGDWWAKAQNIYTIARASWDAGLSAEEISQGYFQAQYGPIAGLMAEHATKCRELFELPLGGKQPLTALDVCFNWGYYENFDPAAVPGNIEKFEQKIAEIKDILNQALKQLPDDDAVLRERLRILKDDAEYLRLAFRFINAVNLYQAQPGEAALAEARAYQDALIHTPIVADWDRHGYSSAYNTLMNLATALEPAEAAK